MAKRKETSASEPSIAFIESLKKRWMATVDAIIDPLMIVNSDYKIIQANKALANHAGLPIRSVLGESCYKVLSGRTSPCDGCTLNKTIKNQENCNFELELESEGRYYEVNSQQIETEDEEQSVALMIYRDRTNAKKMQDRLLQSEKLASIGLLAGGIAHEINNPLAGIMIFAQTLLREMPKDSEYYQDIVEIEAASQRCKAIVAGLLDFARQKPDKVEAKETIDFTDTIEQAIRFISMGGNLESIDVETKFDAPPSFVQGDKNKLVQLLLNLIQNAIHAMPKGGKLDVRSKFVSTRHQQSIHIEIEDTGIGIPADKIKYIFDPFYTSKKQHLGTGLGLSVCHGIAEEMNARITVKSKVNKGSLFTVIIPVENQVKKGA